MNPVKVLLYPDFTALDAFGPVEVLSKLEGCDIRYYSELGGVVTNQQGIRVETQKLADMEPGGILLIPGGFGSRPLAKREDFLAALGACIDAAEWVLCVCTGSALAAAAGRLNGLRATSNKTSFEWVRSCGEQVQWNREARWVADGKFYTSAGVSAGIDMALGFVQDCFGAEKAEEICRRMEYHWNRDSQHDSF